MSLMSDLKFKDLFLYLYYRQLYYIFLYLKLI